MVLSLLVIPALVGGTPDRPLRTCTSPLIILLDVGTSMMHRAFPGGTATATCSTSTLLGTSSIVSCSGPLLGSVACSFLIPFLTL